MEISPSLSVTIDIPSNFDQIQRTTTCNCWKYFIQFGVFLIGLMSFCVFIVLPWMEIVIGFLFRNQCSMNEFIPIYLILAGLLSSILLVFGIYARFFIWPWMDNWKIKTIKSIVANDGIICQIIFGLGIIFLLLASIWFILGNVWVFGNQSIVQYTDPIGSPETYCHRIVYLTSFGSIIVKYLFIWMIICVLNCLVCFDIEQILMNNNRK